MAIDPQHLPEDPKILQQMVLDLMTQPDREFNERNKIESLLRELLDAKRNRKSEQLSADQLALFAAAWQARQAAAESTDDRDDDYHPATPGAGETDRKKRSGGRQALPRHPQTGANRTRSAGRREALSHMPSEPAPDGRGNQRTLRIYSSFGVGGGRCLPEICLCLHGAYGGQAGTAHRKKHGRGESVGTGNRGQECRPSAFAPTGENL